MDDEEFFLSLGLMEAVVIEMRPVQAWENFKLREMCKLIGLLNEFALKLLFVEAIGAYANCEKHVVGLLKQLYTRNSRR